MRKKTPPIDTSKVATTNSTAPISSHDAVYTIQDTRPKIHWKVIFINPDGNLQEIEETSSDFGELFSKVIPRHATFHNIIKIEKRPVYIKGA